MQALWVAMFETYLEGNMGDNGRVSNREICQIYVLNSHITVEVRMG